MIRLRLSCNRLAKGIWWERYFLFICWTCFIRVLHVIWISMFHRHKLPFFFLFFLLKFQYKGTCSLNIIDFDVNAWKECVYKHFLEINKRSNFKRCFLLLTTDFDGKADAYSCWIHVMNHNSVGIKLNCELYWIAQEIICNSLILGFVFIEKMILLLL